MTICFQVAFCIRSCKIKTKYLREGEGRILYNLIIVEDRDELRHSLCNYIQWEQIGFSVCGDFADGRQALDFLLSNPADVVLCDVCMPVMDGLTLAQKVKEANIPVMLVILSAYKDFDYARRAMSYGVKNYIVKPASYEDFAQTFTGIRLELDRVCAAPVRRPDVEDPEKQYPRIIRAAREFVCGNYKTATLESTAEHLGINPFYLSRLYKKMTGENFSDFVTEVRMRNAALLLSDVRLRAHEVSEMLGYSNQNSFARAFKNYYHMSPSAYRDRQEESTR